MLLSRVETLYKASLNLFVQSGISRPFPLRLIRLIRERLTP